MEHLGIDDDHFWRKMLVHQVSVGRQDAWNNLSMIASCSALALVVFDLTFHLQYSIQGTLRTCGYGSKFEAYGTTNVSICLVFPI